MEEEAPAPIVQVGASLKKEARVSRLSDIETCEQIRTKTGMGELDRVLGGGLAVRTSDDAFNR